MPTITATEYGLDKGLHSIESILSDGAVIVLNDDNKAYYITTALNAHNLKHEMFVQSVLASKAEVEAGLVSEGSVDDLMREIDEA